MRKGWLTIPGVQLGDRTVEEQTAALRPAIETCGGKTILDMGAAEGLIAREFVRAGAARAICLESVGDHIAVGLRECAGLPMEFVQCNINEQAADLRFEVDIVLCLGIAHKMHEPQRAIDLAARSARELVLIRSGRGADANGIIRAKHRGATCDSHATMKAAGFVLERVEVGPPPHSEPVEFWRKA